MKAARPLLIVLLVVSLAAVFVACCTPTLHRAREVCSPAFREQFSARLGGPALPQTPPHVDARLAPPGAVPAAGWRRR